MRTSKIPATAGSLFRRQGLAGMCGILTEIEVGKHIGSGLVLTR